MGMLSQMGFYTGPRNLFIYICLYIIFLMSASTIFVPNAILTQLLPSIYRPAVIINNVFINSKGTCKITDIRCLIMVYLFVILVVIGLVHCSILINSITHYSFRILRERKTFSYSAQSNNRNACCCSKTIELVYLYNGIAPSIYPQMRL